MTTPEAVDDLDETRRLLYMALWVGSTDRYELAGTLTNALVHHAPQLPRRDVLVNLAAVLSTQPPSEACWVIEVIDHLKQLAHSRAGEAS